MKNITRLLLLAFAFLFGLSVYSPIHAQEVFRYDVLNVYVYDYVGKVTNFRDKPKGKVVASVPTDYTADCIVDKVKNGWWHIIAGQVYVYEPDTLMVINDGEAWVHYSVIGVASSNYAGQTLTLRAAPRETARARFVFNNEIQFRPLEIKDGWVKVRTIDGKHTGWIEIIWLCGNPVTNCC